MLKNLGFTNQTASQKHPHLHAHLGSKRQDVSDENTQVLGTLQKYMIINPVNFHIVLNQRSTILKEVLARS